MGVRLEPDGTVTRLTPENGTDFSLPELYRATACDCVDIRRLADGRWLIGDDEGLLKGLVYNAAATILYNLDRVGPIAPIVGTVVIADPEEMT